MTYFKMAIGDVSFAGGVVSLESMTYNWDKELAYAAFDVKITVLFIASLEAVVRVQEDPDTANQQLVDFSVTVDAAGLATTVSGSAVMASSFADSKFDVSVSVELGGVLREDRARDQGRRERGGQRGEAGVGHGHGEGGGALVRHHEHAGHSAQKRGGNAGGGAERREGGSRGSGGHGIGAAQRGPVASRRRPSDWRRP
eukprot:Sspe_Gene.28795::Locus_13234_Transcript_1_1_Confidence_1.000_Length_2562::g.28795::m.28795